MPALARLIGHFEHLDNRLCSALPAGTSDFAKLVKEVLITKREIRHFLASHPGSSDNVPFREQLDRIRNNNGYHIDTLYAGYSAKILCPFCKGSNVALIKYRSALSPPPDFARKHNARLRVARDAAALKAGKFACNDCRRSFDADLPSADMRLCEILFEYYG